MFASFNRAIQACRQFSQVVQPFYSPSGILNTPSRYFSSLYNFSLVQRETGYYGNSGSSCSWFLRVSNSSNYLQQSTRSFWERKTVMEKATLKDGKRTTARMVPERFYRLHWGMWIHRAAGAHRKVWSKNLKRYKRSKLHVMCTATQCKLLDRMVEPSYRKKTYFVDDPYNTYHSREDYWLTRRKPVDIPPRL